MITSLHLKNYRGFEDHYVPLHRKTIIVGKNNAGKSTIVEALRLLSLVTSRYQYLDFHKVPQWLDIPAREKGVSPSLRNTEIHLESVFNNYGEPPANIKGTFESGETISMYIGREGVLHAVLRDSLGKIIASRASGHGLHLPEIYILPQVSPLAREEKILTPDYVSRAFFTSLASMHFRNQLNLYYEDYYEEFKQLAESSWPGLRVLELEGRGLLPGDNKLSLLVQDGAFVAEVAWMGHGLQMWLQAMWFLTNNFDDDDTIILDEPDVYMHADLQRRLIRLLRDKPQQVIIATHSTEILAEVEPDHVLIIDRHRRESKFATSLPAVQRVLERIGSAHNIQLTRLWSARRFLLVEGKDITFLKRLQDTLFPESSDPFDTIPHNSIGGWEGWNNVIGSALFLQNAGGEDITTYCLLDSDYHTDEQINSRLQVARKHRIQLHIWSRKEIENYFIVSSAIQRVIATNTTHAPTSDVIDQKIEEIISGLREETVGAIANEFYLADKASGVATALRRAREKVDSVWSSDKLSVISGKKVLSLLSQWSKEIYGVSFGATRISQELQAPEIHPEIAFVIQAIEQNLVFGEPLDSGKPDDE